MSLARREVRDCELQLRSPLHNPIIRVGPIALRDASQLIVRGIPHWSRPRSIDWFGASVHRAY